MKKIKTKKGNTKYYAQTFEKNRKFYKEIEPIKKNYLI